MLDDLQVLNGDMTPKYDKYNNRYTVRVDNNVTKLELDYKINSDNEVNIYGNDSLKEGNNNVFIAITNNNEVNYIYLNVIKEASTTEVIGILDDNIAEDNSSLIYGGPLIILSCILLIITTYVWLFKYKK